MTDNNDMPDNFDIACYDGMYMFADPQKVTVPITKYHKSPPVVDVEEVEDDLIVKLNKHFSTLDLKSRRIEITPKYMIDFILSHLIVEGIIKDKDKI